MFGPFCVFRYNGSYDNVFINRSSDNCFYSMYWNASVFSLAVVTRMPRFVPWPVQAPSVMTLFRPKRDFEITTAIVTAISNLKEWAGNHLHCHRSNGPVAHLPYAKKGIPVHRHC